MKPFALLLVLLCGSAAWGQAKTIPEKVDCKVLPNGTYITNWNQTCQCPKDYEPREATTYTPCSREALGCPATAISEVACHLKASAKHVVQKNVPLCADRLNDGELSAPYACDQVNFTGVGSTTHALEPNGPDKDWLLEKRLNSIEFVPSVNDMTTDGNVVITAVMPHDAETCKASGGEWGEWIDYAKLKSSFQSLAEAKGDLTPEVLALDIVSAKRTGCLIPASKP